MKIWLKLFLAISATVALALGLMTFGIWKGFDRGFVGYLERWQEVEIATLEDRLIAAYEESGDWGFLREPPDVQIETLGMVVAPPLRRGRGSQRDSRGPGGRPPPRGQDRPPPPRAQGNPPPTLRFPTSQKIDESEPPGHRRGRRPPRREGLFELGGRVTILDAGGQRVAGPPDSLERGVSRELLLDGNKIGTLLVSPAPGPERELDIQFATEQRNIALLIGLGIILLSAPLSFWMARRLTAPVQTLADATREVAAGKYESRVDIQTHDELEQLGGDFNQMAGALERNREQQRRWLAEISHELRTPIAVLTGEIQALSDGVRDVTPNSLASLEQETERLSRLVEDLYTLSVSDAGGTSYRQDAVDLAALLRDFLQRCDAASLKLEHDMPGEAWVEGDSDRLQQLLINLFQNSERYTDQPGAIRVTLADAGKDWVLKWEDSEPGVSEAELPQLFDPLYRVETSRDRRFGGAGLGLAIVRSIVENHDGDIHAHCSELGGLCVEVRFPKGEGA